MNLLIVDDEEAIRASCKYLGNFEALHINYVYEATNVYEAKEIIENNRIDIVLTDIEMPGLNGLDLMQWLLQNYPKIKIIVISGYQNFEYVIGSMRSGALDYLLKPIDPDELNLQLEKAVEMITKDIIEKEKTEDENFECMRKFIEDNYIKAFSLTELADKFGFNPSYISRRFKQKYSLSLVEYVTKIRIQKACELLKDTDLRILDVAMNVGFTDEKYFSRVFSKYMKISPKEYKYKFIKQ